MLHYGYPYFCQQKQIDGSFYDSKILWLLQSIEHTKWFKMPHSHSHGGCDHGKAGQLGEESGVQYR